MHPVSGACVFDDGRPTLLMWRWLRTRYLLLTYSDRCADVRLARFAEILDDTPVHAVRFDVELPLHADLDRTLLDWRELAARLLDREQKSCTEAKRCTRSSTSSSSCN
jgi:hypothetical protein